MNKIVYILHVNVCTHIMYGSFLSLSCTLFLSSLVSVYIETNGCVVCVFVVFTTLFLTYTCTILVLDALPRTLMILNLKKNPCTCNDDYRKSILDGLPHLKQLDGKQIEEMERVKNESNILSDESDEESEKEEEEEDEESSAVNGGLTEVGAPVEEASKIRSGDEKEESFSEGSCFLLHFFFNSHRSTFPSSVSSFFFSLFSRLSVFSSFSILSSFTA